MNFREEFFFYYYLSFSKDIAKKEEQSGSNLWKVYDIFLFVK